VWVEVDFELNVYATEDGRQYDYKKRGRPPRPLRGYKRKAGGLSARMIGGVVCFDVDFELK